MVIHKFLIFLLLFLTNLLMVSRSIYCWILIYIITVLFCSNNSVIWQCFVRSITIFVCSNYCHDWNIEQVDRHVAVIANTSHYRRYRVCFRFLYTHYSGIQYTLHQINCYTCTCSLRNCLLYCR